LAGARPLEVSIGAQVGARLLENVSTADFRRIFAMVLVGLAGYLFFQR